MTQSPELFPKNSPDDTAVENGNQDEQRKKLVEKIKKEIQLKINFDPDDNDYIVTIPSIFPLVSTFADTRNDAIEEMMIALEGVLEFLSIDELNDVCNRLEYLS